MSTFGMTPVSGYPPAVAGDFPTGVQYQFKGINVGDTSVNTINVVPGPATNMTVDEFGVLTITVFDPNPSLW